MYTKIITRYCGECGARVEQELYDGWSSTRGEFGPAAVPCPKCGVMLVSGQREWMDTSWPRRIGYLVIVLGWALVAMLVCGALGGGLLAALLLWCGVFGEGQRFECTAVSGAVVAVVVLLKVVLDARRDIRRSLARTAAETTADEDASGCDESM